MYEQIVCLIPVEVKAFSYSSPWGAMKSKPGTNRIRRCGTSDTKQHRTKHQANKQITQEQAGRIRETDPWLLAPKISFVPFSSLSFFRHFGTVTRSRLTPPPANTKLSVKIARLWIHMKPGSTQPSRVFNCYWSDVHYRALSPRRHSHLRLLIGWSVNISVDRAREHPELQVGPISRNVVTLEDRFAHELVAGHW